MKRKHLTNKEYQNIREVLQIKGMTMKIASGLTKRAVSTLLCIQKYPTLAEYKNYWHDYQKRLDEQKKTKEVKQEVKKEVTPVYKSTTDETTKQLTRIADALEQLVQLKIEGREYAKKKNGWFGR